VRGLLIAIEGKDGTGKRTQSRLLGNYLAERGLEVVHYSFPAYESEYGKILKNFLAGNSNKNVKTLFLTYLADMTDQQEKIEKDLDAGKVVIMDRYFFSTIAYQSACGFDYEKAKAVEDIFALPRPNLVIFFENEIISSMLRKEKQREEEGGRKDRFESSSEIQRGVDTYYKMMFKENYAGKWVRINAEQSIDEVQRDVRASVSPLLEIRLSKIRA
jgi:dTMP kinase